jgi:hypothetical protein
MACTLPSDRSKRTTGQVLQGLDGYALSVSYFTESLPERTGERPDCETCLPHAQRNQQSPDDLFMKLKERALTALLVGSSLSSSSSSAVTVGHSTVSMPSSYPAFHLICRDCATMPSEACMTPGGPTCGTEFCHFHTQYYPPDSSHAQANNASCLRWQEWQGGGQGSMHICLTLKDAASVLEKKWGERHLLAGQSPRPGFTVPQGLLLVYAPRTLEELEVSLTILQAGFAFAKSNN